MRRLLSLMLGLFAAVAVLANGTLAASADTITALHFDELAFQPVNGLHFNGATFHFSINKTPSTDANYNSFGPGPQYFTQDPALEGNAAGKLVVAFDSPTTFVKFGVSLSAFAPLAPGFVVTLKDSNGKQISLTQVNTRPVGPDFFTEGQFTYNGSFAVKKVVITFASGDAARFVVDNLVYVVPSAATMTRSSATGGSRWALSK